MSVVALVPAAGRGERLGAAMPKALVPVRGVPLLVHAVRGLLAAGCVHHVVIAAPPAEVGIVTSALDPSWPVHVVPGGAERTDSVRLALDAALREVPLASVVLVHDAARAFTPPVVIRSVVRAVLAGQSAVIPVLPVADTIKRVDVGGLVTATLERTTLRVAQTPQGFRVDVLRRAHAMDVDGSTDDAGLVERLGEPVGTVPGHPHALKITTPFDLAVAESLLAGAAR